jgi:phosphate transport system permease protein
MRARLLKDTAARHLGRILAILPGLVLALITVGLLLRSRPILDVKPLPDLLFSTSWHPLRGEFGFLPFIAGTLWVTIVATVLAVPLSVLAAIHLSEYAHRKVRALMRPLVDLLAGIPSVIYGIWGILIIVPFIKSYLAPAVGATTTGYCVLAGSVVLAVMVFPILIHVTIEVFQAVPRELREASLALGATQWQTIKHVVLRKARSGIVAAVILATSRVFGETMAVLMVVGNVARVPGSVFDPAYPLPALIANNYGEMMSVPLYDSALLLAALVLLVCVVGFNAVAQLVLLRLERKAL